MSERETTSTCTRCEYELLEQPDGAEVSHHVVELARGVGDVIGDVIVVGVALVDRRLLRVVPGAAHRQPEEVSFAQHARRAVRTSRFRRVNITTIMRECVLTARC